MRFPSKMKSVSLYDFSVIRAPMYTHYHYIQMPIMLEYVIHNVPVL